MEEEFVDASSDWLDDESLSTMMEGVEVQGVAKVEEPKISLTREQQLVCELVHLGKNVFFTGSGGTGKTFLMQHILGFLSAEYQAPGDVVITAPTGIAAIPIGGSTIHSATGIGIPRTTEDFSRMWKQPNRKKWRTAKVWIIDEISMVSAEMLEYLEQTISKIRTTSIEVAKPFGGLQVIFAGDFFQLQPVQERSTATTPQSNQFLNRGLAFEALAWHRANLETVILKNNFRQGDGDFIKMLNGIRTGENPAALEDIAKRCSRELDEVAGIKPTVLYSKNKAADEYNLKELNALPDEVGVIWIDPQPAKQPVVLVADDSIVTLTMESNDPVRYREELRVLEGAEFWKSCLAVNEITLKIGAQVMLLRNLELAGKKSDLVNGSRGVVIGWKSKKEKLEALQRKVDQLKPASGSKVHPEEAKLLSAIGKLNRSSIEFIPVVAFRNKRSLECDPELFEYPVLNVGECRRLQVPLKLAWAITIHKCQGMTLDYVKVYLKDIFAEGQVYVALSRARSMNGLQVVGRASRSYVKVSPKVVEFYEALARKEVHPVPQLRFPALVLDFPEQDLENIVVQPGRKHTSSTSENPFEKCPEQVFWNKKLLPDREVTLPVVCYHCNKEGHPAWACKLGKKLRINC